MTTLDAGAAGGACSDLQPYPSREGFLILGKCEAPAVPRPEACAPGTAEPPFGIALCKCVRTRAFVRATIDGATVAPRPHDMPRVRLKLKPGCDL